MDAVASQLALSVLYVCGYIYVYINVCMHIYICVFTYKYIDVHIYTCMSVPDQAFVAVTVIETLCIYIYVYISKCTDMCIFVTVIATL